MASVRVTESHHPTMRMLWRHGDWVKIRKKGGYQLLFYFLQLVFLIEVVLSCDVFWYIYY